MPLLSHPVGNYRFLPGIAPYSCGVVADQGFEVLRVQLTHSIPLPRGFDQIAQLLAEYGRPKAALCAVELRSPRPMSFAEFGEFNAQYAAVLRDWDVFVGGVNPVARTNVAPESSPPPVPSLYAFSFTIAAPEAAGQTFVVAGGGELPEGKLDRESIVALGDVSETGIAAKARFVLDLMGQRLVGLGVSGESVTAVNVYTIHDLSRLLSGDVLPRLPSACRDGVHWHYTRPPIREIEYEMDLHGVRRELRLEPAPEFR